MNSKPSIPCISVLLADDHTIVREGLKTLLDAEGDIRVVGEAKTGREAVAMAKRLRPAVIVMDIAMPVLNGMEATRQILAAIPEAKVVILSAHSDDVYVDRVMALGARGYLLKQASARALTRAVRDVEQGSTYFCSSITSRLNDPARRSARRGHLTTSSPLSHRESEVLQLIAEGRANKQIAAELGISIKTVEKHRQRLMEKLRIHDTASLTRYAVESGTIEGRVQLAGG